MSDTPRTDEVARINEKPNSLQYCEEYVPADFARQLERELKEALEHQEVPFHTCGGKDCKNKYCQMRKENERLKTELEQIKDEQFHQGIERDLNT